MGLTECPLLAQCRRVAMSVFGRYRMESGRDADIAIRSRMTHSRHAERRMQFSSSEPPQRHSALPGAGSACAIWQSNRLDDSVPTTEIHQFQSLGKVTPSFGKDKIGAFDPGVCGLCRDAFACNRSIAALFCGDHDFFNPTIPNENQLRRPYNKATS